MRILGQLYVMCILSHVRMYENVLALTQASIQRAVSLDPGAGQKA